MADEMLARLDRLQRGARVPPSRRQEHNTHNAYTRYDAYETEPDYYGGEEMYGDENVHPSDVHGMQISLHVDVTCP